LIRKLVAKGADVNTATDRRAVRWRTASRARAARRFILAADTADHRVPEACCVELGADPTLTNADGSTALMAAAGLGTRSAG
jgi:hypothetical protein